MPRGLSPNSWVLMVFNNLPVFMLCTVTVLSASLVTISCLPSLLNSMPSVSGPPVISRIFLPNFKSMIPMRAGSLSSSSASSLVAASASAEPGAGGGPPLALGS